MKKDPEIGLPPDVVWEEMDGEAVVVSPSQQKAWVLNSTATRLWKLFARGFSVSRVARELARDCRLPLDRLETEVSAFAAKLAQNGLLMPGSGEKVLAFESLFNPAPGFSLFEAAARRRNPSPTGNSPRP